MFNIAVFLSALRPTVDPIAFDLINALKANPTFTVNEPSSDFTEFLRRINSADPAAFAGVDDEDQTNECWGHYQFTSGSLTCTRVITSWHDVGSPAYACKIIAAALTTCQVARWLCRDRNPQPSFLSDNYLAEVINLLWSCWKSADGVSNSLHQLRLL